MGRRPRSGLVSPYALKRYPLEAQTAYNDAWSSLLRGFHVGRGKKTSHYRFDAAANWPSGARAAGRPPSAQDQIRRWIFGKRVAGFDEMHDLSKPLRAALGEDFRLFSSEIERHQVAGDRTEKLLLRLDDGSRIECVLMREPDRRTICLSTQVGCGMGCVFCASGLLGLKRNLSVGEILEQVLRLDRLMGPEERITNVVVMGIGEPLANLKSVLPAMETLNEKGARAGHPPHHDFDGRAA